MKLTENVEFYKKISNESRESNRNNVNKKVNELKLQRFLDEKTTKRSTKSRSKNISFLLCSQKFKKKVIATGQSQVQSIITQLNATIP